ncbi:MAG: hypothetical protein A2902_03530 [Elusimicrobia bacterium RIFCSPLOWO2_01_FULL_64_13]|nr:MAG: hypothetical protein A2636_05605 [Elusimicrobia bacterium RIFCSPHIGHO2_01_FULL_64_10]OGR97168.1 MAG: hypothetical protein A2902_03530 [Elusimicrobia bacterium RIFCSPLOWO2_01_FULL_64_13]
MTPLPGSFRNWSIRKKLRAIIISVGAFMIASIGIWFLTLEMRTRHIHRLTTAMELDNVLHEYEIEVMNNLVHLHRLAHLGRKYEGELDPETCGFGKWYKSFRPPYQDEKFMTPFGRLGHIHSALHHTFDEIVKLHQSGKRVLAFKLVSTALTDNIDMAKSNFNLLTEFMDTKEERAKEMIRLLTLIQYGLIVLFAVVWAVFLWLGVKFAKSASRTLTELKSAADAVASGSLGKKLQAAEAGGEIGALISSFNNMSNSLRRITGFLNAITSSSPVALISSDLDGKITFFSPSAETVTGYPIGEAIGQPLTMLIPQRYRKALMESFKRAVESGDLNKLNSSAKGGTEISMRMKSGEEIPCEIYLSSMRGSNDPSHAGELIGFVAAVLDLREKKKLQGQLFQQDKLAAVGQLAGGVAHEINNPLGVILGFAQSLLNRMGKEDPMRMPLESIEREAGRCRDLVQNLLTFSRMRKLEREECDLNEEVGKALSIVEASTKAHSVELERDLAEGLPKLTANGTQIQQVVINLANNSIDAMPRGGILTVRTRRAENGGREFLQIQVEDNGEGIPEEIRSRIFDPFYTTKEVGKGTGLGLSIVHEIVQIHGGGVAVRSEAGKGSEFTVSIPLSKEAPRGDQP